MRSWTKISKRFANTTTTISRDILKTDVVIVGGGPAGLAAGYRLKLKQPDLQVTLLEKGPDLGSHLLSGAVFDPIGLDTLIPEWRKDESCPILKSPVNRDEFWILTNEKGSFKLPWLPKRMRNEGNFIGSLSQLGRWLGTKCEQVGVDLFPGVSGQSLIIEDNQPNKVHGIISNDVGLDKQGKQTTNFQPGLEIRAKHTLLAEGAHGHLSKQVIEKFQLRAHCQHQTYALGLKEVWQAPRERVHPGLVVHTLGWPLTRHKQENIYGGGFLYTFPDNDNTDKTNISVGYVIALDYQNPYLNLYNEFQLFKTHPMIRQYLDQADILAYGARVLNEGGWQSLPKLIFPGGMLLGCAAGMVNVPRIKGNHNAVLSGILAADSILHDKIDTYDHLVHSSTIGKELQAARNVRPSFHHFGFLGGLVHSAISVMLNGKEPWTLTHGPPDYAVLKSAQECRPIKDYIKPDGKLTFDVLSNVARTGVMHREGQPSHLLLKNPEQEVQIHYEKYDGGPESRFCPAGVYEYVNSDISDDTTSNNETEKKIKFQVNAQNCIHCKTCDIKCPSQNIQWVTPEGGGGPKYTIT